MHSFVTFCHNAVDEHAIIEALRNGGKSRRATEARGFAHAYAGVARELVEATAVVASNYPLFDILVTGDSVANLG